MAFDPSQLANLVFAWRPDDPGIVVDGSSNIISVPGAFGTSVFLQGTAPNQPKLLNGFGPLGQALFQFNAATPSFCTLVTSGGAANAQTLGAFTIAGIFAVQGAVAAPDGLFGYTLNGGTLIQFASNNLAMQMRINAGATVTAFLPFTAAGTASGNENLTNSLRFFTLTYDQNAGTNGVFTLAADTLAGPPIDDPTIARGTFIIDVFGALRASANPYNGLMGPVVGYSRVLTGTEIAQLYQYFAPYRPTKLYVSNMTGNDASVMPWNPATPFKSDKAGYAIVRPGQTLLIDNSTISRYNVNVDKMIPPIPGTAAQPIVIDFQTWGTNSGINGGQFRAPKHQIRGSTTPPLVALGGTLYAIDGIVPSGSYPQDTMYAVMGTVRTNPGLGTQYVPIQFGPQFATPFPGVPAVNCCISVLPKYSCNVIRMFNAAAATNNPTPGFWWHDAAGTFGTVNRMYLNAGTALVQGQVEIPSNIVNGLLINQDYWTVIGANPTFNFGSGLDCQTLNLIVTNAVNNGSGLIRLTTGSTGLLHTGQQFVVSGVNGTTEANGTWPITVINATTVDLQGSAFVHAFSAPSGVLTANADSPQNFVVVDLEANFNQQDGCDFFNHSKTVLNSPVCMFNGAGLTNSGAAGDGVSGHDTAQFIMKGTPAKPVLMIHNDKSCTSGHSGVTMTVEFATLIGTRTAGVNDNPPNYGGSYSYTNCLMILPPGMPDPSASENTAQGAAALNLQFCTLFSSTPYAGSTGVNKLSDGSVPTGLPTATVQNCLIQGFQVGQFGPTNNGWTTSYNALSNNTTNYVHVAPGSHDIIIVDRVIPGVPVTETDLRPAGSSLAGKGRAVSGILLDYSGNIRADPPSIGAFEAMGLIQGGSSGPAYGQTYDRKTDDEEEEVLALLH